MNHIHQRMKDQFVLRAARDILSTVIQPDFCVVCEAWSNSVHRRRRPRCHTFVSDR